MINSEFMAQVKEIDPADTKALFAALRERVGQAAFREAFFDVVGEGALGADDNPLPVIRQVGAFLHNLGEPRPMQIDRLIPDNSLLLMSGKPKFSKSFVALDIAEQVARGGQLWGEFTINKPGPVIYFGMEDGDIEIGNRLLKRGLRSNDTELPLHICYNHIRLSDPSGVALLRLLCESIKPVMIVIDTAREALGVQDWNNPAELTEKLRPIRQFAREVCTVIMVAHNRKAGAEDAVDEIGGSNSFASSVDGWLSARRKEDLSNGNRRLYINVDGRGGMRGELCIEMDTNTTRFSLVSNDTLVQEKKEQNQQSRYARYEPVLRAIHDAPGKKATPKQIEQASGISGGTLFRLVKDALAEGIIADTGEKAAAEKAGKPAVLYTIGERGINFIQSFSIGNNVDGINSPSQTQPEPPRSYLELDDEPELF